MEDVYENLRKRLDDLAAGFPATESGVEINILKRLFTEEEAGFALHLSPIPESPEDVAKRLGLDAAETTALMEKMAKKGLLFRVRKDNVARYAVVPYVVGIFEFQVKRMDSEFAREMSDYFETALGDTWQSYKTPMMRTIPINREVAVKWRIAPYEDVMKIVENQKAMAIVPCVCRTWMDLSDHECDKPMETCFMFGSHAHYYVENEMGRYIDKEEAREIVKRNDEVGLVMQPFNSQKMGGMCSCCGDCCGMLRSLKKQPNPAAAVQSNYFADVDAEACIGCETCLERCQMEAIDMVEDKAVINLDRCIGCGLCVTTCSTEAAQLIRRPDEHLYEPPETGVGTYIAIMKERGKI
jgi:electron transport complex protein RnfB